MDKVTFKIKLNLVQPEISLLKKIWRLSLNDFKINDLFLCSLLDLLVLRKKIKLNILSVLI